MAPICLAQYAWPLRLLQNDIPHRVVHSFGMVWVYRDPQANIVGFGTLDLCTEYARFTEGKYHSYIPLLAVNPGFRKRGHCRSIVQHLIGELLGGLSPQDEQRLREAVNKAVLIYNYWRPELRYKITEVNERYLHDVQRAAKWLIDNQSQL
jgi:hypothetical protein